MDFVVGVGGGRGGSRNKNMLISSHLFCDGTTAADADADD